MTDPIVWSPGPESQRTPAPRASVSASQPSRRRRAAMGAMAVLAVGAGAFGVVALSAGDGADDPEAAVDAMFDAIEQEDVIGVLEALDPTEREILRPAVEEARDQAQRVEVLSPDLDLREVAGFDIEVSGLTYESETLGDGIAAVDLTGGTVSSATDLDAMPVGSTIRQILDRDAAESDGPVDRTSQDEIELAGTRLVARQGDGGWHVSVLYSIAESIRTDQDDAPPVPDFGNGVPAKGAVDPEAAVREMIAAATEVDVERIIELTPPDEAAVLHDYGPLLVDAARDAEGDGWQGPEIANLSLATTNGRDGTKVVTATAYEITTADDYSSVIWSYDGSCTTITTTYSEEMYGEDDGFGQGPTSGRNTYGDDSSGGTDEYEPMEAPKPDVVRSCRDDESANGTFAPLLLAGMGSGTELAVVTVQRDGAWYVSPTRSLIQSTFGGLTELTPEQAKETARVFSGDDWLAQPDSFWEACGVADPGPDASRADGNQAQETCWEKLPEDYLYEGGYGGGLPWFALWGLGRSTETKFESVGEQIEGSNDVWPEDACYSDSEGAYDVYGEGDIDAYEASVETCLTDLVERGAADPSVVLDFTCKKIYTRIEVSDEASEAETNAAYEAADQAYEECQAAG